MSGLGTGHECNSVLQLCSSKSFLAEGYQIAPLPNGMYMPLALAHPTQTVALHSLALHLHREQGTCMYRESSFLYKFLFFYRGSQQSTREYYFIIIYNIIYIISRCLQFVSFSIISPKITDHPLII